MKKLLYPLVLCSFGEVHGALLQRPRDPLPESIRARVETYSPQPATPRPLDGSGRTFRVEKNNLFQGTPRRLSDPPEAAPVVTTPPPPNPAFQGTPRKLGDPPRSSRLKRPPTNKSGATPPAEPVFEFQGTDPLPQVKKQPAVTNVKFWKKDKICIAKVNAVIGIDGYLQAFFVPGGLAAITAQANGRPVIVINANDGVVTCPDFFNSIEIRFSDGQQSVFYSDYFHDEKAQKTLQNKHLGGPNWTSGDRFRIENWFPRWIDGNGILVLIYNGRVYLLVYSRTQDTGLNAIRSTDWHSSKTKKAILAAAGVVAAGALGYGAYQLGSNLLASQAAAAAAAREAERNLLLRGVSGIASENTQNITKQMSAGFDQTQNAINTGFGQLDSKVSAGFNQTQNAMNTGLDQLGSKLGGQLDRGLFQVQNTAANQGQILKTFTQNQMERNSLIGLGRQGGRATVAGAKAVGNATVASARAAGRGVRAAGKGVWNAGGSLVTGTAEGVKTIGRGITGAGRAIGNIFSRNPKSLPQK